MTDQSSEHTEKQPRRSDASPRPQRDQAPRRKPEEQDEPLPTPAENPVPEPPETIEGLVFEANPNYPYPFKVAKPPRFWMEETSGVLEEAVDTYMNGEKLAVKQIEVIKVYLKQYVERAVLTGAAHKPSLLRKIDKLKSPSDIERFADEVADLGAEVF